MVHHVTQGAAQVWNENEYPVKQVFQVWGETQGNGGPFQPEFVVREGAIYRGRKKERTILYCKINNLRAMINHMASYPKQN